MTTHTHPSRQRPLQTLPVLLGLLVQAAIASPALAKPTLAPQRFVVIPKTHHPWFDKVRKGARAAAVMIEAQNGGKASIDYRPPSKADAGEQANILEAAIRSRPTGITVVATPIDQDSITIAEQQALATMERHPQLRGWVVADAGGGIGVGRAIQNLNRTGDVKVVALDDLPEQLGNLWTNGS